MTPSTAPHRRRRRPQPDRRAPRSAPSQVSNGTSGERSTRGSSSLATKASQPRAPLGERQVAQVLRRRRPADRRRADAREIPASSFGVTALRLSRCCSTLNDCTRPSRTISSSPSIAPGSRSASARSGKLFGDVLAGARIEPRRRRAVLVRAGDRLHADAVPFPFRREVARIERGEIGLLDRMRQHRRPERRRIARSPASRRGLRARRTARCRAAPGRARALRSRSAPCRRARRRRSWRAAPRRRCAGRR